MLRLFSNPVSSCYFKSVQQHKREQDCSDCNTPSFQPIVFRNTFFFPSLLYLLLLKNVLSAGCTFVWRQPLCPIQPQTHKSPVANTSGPLAFPKLLKKNHSLKSRWILLAGNIVYVVNFIQKQTLIRLTNSMAYGTRRFNAHSHSETNQLNSSYW
jgi:hypothetical protein